MKVMVKKTSVLLLIFSFFSFSLIGTTNSYFRDQVKVGENTVSTGDWTAPEVTWVKPLDGDTESGKIKLVAECDGTGSESQYVNFWWYKASEGQTVTGSDGAVGNHQYHYVRRGELGADVVLDTFSWELDTTDDSLKSPNYDWDGEWVFRAACKDEYGNYAHAEIDVVIDYSAPEIPETIGFNSTKTDYSKRPVEVECDGRVYQNQISHHWTKVTDAVEYERQWVYPGGDPNNESDWHGSEKWTTPYTNYRKFGGDPGTQGIWYVRVRARDEAGNWSGWSDPCSVYYVNRPVYNVEHECPEGTVKADDPEQTIEINSNDADGEEISFTGGETYLLEVSGTYSFDVNSSPQREADAGYATDDNWNSQLDWRLGIDENAELRGVTSLLGDLGSGVGIINWGPYNSGHQYSALYSPSGSENARFLISDWYDNWYEGNCANQSCMSDNDGYLTLDVYKCVAETSPTETPTPTSTETPTPTETSTPTPTATPTEEPSGLPDVVINEVYYDVADDRGTESKNEWVELYNDSDQSVSLKGWKLVDDAGNEKKINADVDLPKGEYAVLSHDNSTWINYWVIRQDAVKLNGTGGGAWLNDDGDSLTLYNQLDEEVDFVAWEGVSGWSITADEGQSIARSTAGYDSNNDGVDDQNDWTVLGDEVGEMPNPGTNPHSHVQVDLSQSGQDLIVDFNNAGGVDKVKYSVFYDHQYEGSTVDFQIDGEKGKPLDQTELSLDPLYIGSCSSQGIVCTPHEQVDNMEVHLLYKDGVDVLGTSSYDFDWKN